MKKAELDVKSPSEGARQWAREALPGVSRTFALNIRLLPGDLRDSVTVAYLLCRTADALEDSWPGTAAEVGGRFDQLASALDGDDAAACALAAAATGLHAGAHDLRLVARLPRLLEADSALSPADRPTVRDCAHTMIAGMRRYATRAADRGGEAPYLDDDPELHDYCHVVAGCVGEMLSRLFESRAGDSGSARSAERMRLAPVMGEALQLTNILLDWPRDARDGRCHLPASWLAPYGLTPARLVSADHEVLRALAVRLEALARAALARVPEYLDCVPVPHVRYRAFCLWPALWARASLARAMGDPRFPDTAGRPRLSRGELWGWVFKSLPAIGSDRATRRLFAVAR